MRCVGAISRGTAMLFAVSMAGACSMLGRFTPAGPQPERRSTELERRSAEPNPLYPGEAVPRGDEARTVWEAALEADSLRIIISIQHRRLWLVDHANVLLSAPVAVGTGETFVWHGEEFVFHTPRGRREVLAKGTDPLWAPPDWHYFELAAERDLELVQLQRGDRIPLPDSTTIAVRANQVGRINQFGNFWPFTPGTEIIFNDTIFVPPFGTAQRKVPEVLGTHKLELGDGYLIHGTNEEDTIGEAVSHGCVRMYNEDVAELFGSVAVGTPVYIY